MNISLFSSLSKSSKNTTSYPVASKKYKISSIFLLKIDFSSIASFPRVALENNFISFNFNLIIPCFIIIVSIIICNTKHGIITYDQNSGIPKLIKKLIQLITFSFKTSGKNNTLPIKQNILTQKVHIKMYI